MRILLATDGFPTAEAALEVVLYRPWPAGTEVRVISVLEPLQYVFNKAFAAFGGIDSVAQRAYGKLSEHTKEMVDKYYKRLANKFGADNVTHAILEGVPREKIVEEARHWKADTIILGAHGRTQAGDFVFGSVPEFVISHSHCPVEILRAAPLSTMVTELERAQPIEEDKYLIALDDSKSSEDTLAEVLSREWPDGAHFRVISVVEPLPFQAYAGLGSWEGVGNREFEDLLDKTLEAEAECARAVTENAISKLKARFPKAAAVTGEILEGFAKDRILKAAKEWPSDLIILGSHGRRGFVEFVLGSVSKATAMHASCSVLIVRPKEAIASAGKAGKV